jgi:hypothetical protein
MPTYRLLQNSAFEPEHVAAMKAAFEGVCRDLRLSERNDYLRDIIAKAVIVCAQTGERDLIRLRECVHAALKAQAAMRRSMATISRPGSL